MGSRRKARECALQILFQLEFSPDRLEEILQDYWAAQPVKPEIKEYATWLVEGIKQHRAEIDQTIEKASEHWRLDRMAMVDRNILRMAVFELIFEKNLPPPIIIDEAIEVARKYSGQEAAVFVNGILDGIYKSLPENRAENKKASDNSVKKEEGK
ncbi:MAG TPA: transcription antitermination factor NusB [Candidatus Saccharicenans sp.]|nr:transcription antitermination factor NusB [Candidatus Saccharicenans sp.]HOP60995.1 transcription antitermination factor NusB [Candidatus Saccharicenans sp.]HPP23798.1 transcription antitermination factor NusB [Candidatus Saccharicenans sp.]HPU93315.1 transcription antitermination factor NusB [Candidatus Saccharicenans sp.]